MLYGTNQHSQEFIGIEEPRVDALGQMRNPMSAWPGTIASLVSHGCHGTESRKKPDSYRSSDAGNQMLAGRRGLGASSPA